MESDGESRLQKQNDGEKSSGVVATTWRVGR